MGERYTYVLKYKGLGIWGFLVLWKREKSTKKNSFLRNFVVEKRKWKGKRHHSIWFMEALDILNFLCWAAQAIFLVLLIPIVHSPFTICN